MSDTKSQYFRCDEHVLPGQHIRQYPRATSRSQEETLQLAIKQYTPLDNLEPHVSDVTIIAVHGNGFAKELYEPMWDELYLSCKASGSFRIRSIWIADTAWAGYSATLNEGKLGNDPSLQDHARDLLYMVNHFRMPRPIVGFAHSSGGAQMIALATMHPRLFHTTVLVEPFSVSTMAGSPFIPAYLATRRRDRWPSRKEAENNVRKNPFYRDWDPRVREKYITHALRDLPAASDGSNPVVLRTTKQQEAFSSARPNFPFPGQHDIDPASLRDTIERDHNGDAFVRPEAIMAFRQLPSLLPSCCFVYGALSNFPVAQAPARAENLRITGTGLGGSGGIRRGRVSETLIDGGSHFCPFEKPKALAESISSWLAQEQSRYNEEEDQYRKSWLELKDEEKVAFNDTWNYWIAHQFQQGTKIASNNPGTDRKVLKL